MARSPLFDDMQNRLRDLRRGIAQLSKEEQSELMRQLVRTVRRWQFRRNLVNVNRSPQQDLMEQLNRILQDSMKQARSGEQGE